jgi:hypothetical protein
LCHTKQINIEVAPRFSGGAKSRQIGKTESKKEIYDGRMLLADAYSTVQVCDARAAQPELLLPVTHLFYLPTPLPKLLTAPPLLVFA